MKVVSAAESSRHLNNILLKTETWSAILSVFRFAVFDTLSDLSEAYPDGFKILEYSREGHQVSNRGFTKSLVKFTRQNIKDVYIKSRHQQADGTVGWSEKCKARELMHPDNRFILATDNSGVLVGMNCYYITGNIAYVMELGVDRLHRREGLGRLLMAKLESRVTQNGCNVVFLTLQNQNFAAADFYTSLGYKKLLTFPSCYLLFKRLW